MSWVSELDELKQFFQGHGFSSSWLENSQIIQKIEDIQQNLDRDLKFLSKDAAFVFSVGEEIENQTLATINLLHKFTMGPICPSLTALTIHAMQGFGITDTDLQKLVLTASVMGEIDNPQPYHSNMHYRKVTFQLMRMIAVYNDIYEGTSRAFNEHQISLLLATACIHDLGHDGKGNTVKGVYIPHRLEQNTYDMVEPVFNALGNRGEFDLLMMRVMLLCTDVTPFKDPGNAVNQAKTAYRFHFLPGKSAMDSLNLDEDLQSMEKCPAMAAMALMMHEADIATSAGLHYDVTKYETGLLMKEVSDGEARPEHVMNFLNDICNRQMLSEVGQQLFAANLARIYALAEDDYRNGNRPYPPLESSDFVRGITRPYHHAKGSDSIN
ncbi:MAG: hypothetical protein ACK4VI_02200 [Alphaproteobacteria bacterium]